MNDAHLSMRTFLICLIALTLSACGDATDNPYLDLTRDVLAGMGEQSESNARRLPPLSNKALAAAKKPLIYTRIEDSGGEARLSLFGENRSVLTYMSPDRVSLSYDNGLLIATRGLPGDLMVADLRGVQAALSGKSMRYTRIFKHLDGEGQSTTLNFTCTINSLGSQEIEIAGRALPLSGYRESCSGSHGTFTNQLWRDRTGVIRVSKQWSGPLPGYIETIVLKDKSDMD